MPLTRDDQGRARIGGVALVELLARADVPTPAYVVDVDGVVANAEALLAGFGAAPGLVCYAVKANAAGRLLRRLAAVGVGADVVSGGELALALAVGVAPDRIVYSGVAKRDDELDRAIGVGPAGILAVQIESVEELPRIAARARALGRSARVSIRVNPSIEADTHAHIATGHDEAKFGVPIADVPGLVRELARRPEISLVGLSTHIGSQMTAVDEYVAAAEKLTALARDLEQDGPPLRYVDFGGGFGVDYGAGCAAKPADFVRASRAVLDRAGFGDRMMLAEPGRCLVAAETVILTRVIQRKAWRRETSAGWVFVDAGMNDLLRPALYGARHRIEPIAAIAGEIRPHRVAGPVCESSDDFGTYDLPVGVLDAVVIRDAGAYGQTMASQYNGRPIAAEVFVEGGRVSHVAAGTSVDRWVADRLAT